MITTEQVKNLRAVVAGTWGPEIQKAAFATIDVLEAEIAVAEEKRTGKKARRKAVRRAVKELYEGAYGLATEYSGAGAVAMFKEANDALQTLNAELGLNIKLKEF